MRGTIVRAVVTGLFAVALFDTLMKPQLGPRINPRRPATEIERLSNDIERFRSDCGRFPTSLEDLLTKPEGAEFLEWGGPYIKTPTVDPWGRPLNYRIPGIHNADGFDLWSLGPDGKSETSDDSTNWPLSK